MQKARRENLRAAVSKLRRNVEGGLGQRLATFGLFVDSAPSPIENLMLKAADQALLPRLLSAVTREGRATGVEGPVKQEAVARYRREAGSTWVNRLAALRALEVRGFLSPAAAFISDEYGGVSPRAKHLREVAAEQGRRLDPLQSIVLGIEDACRELSSDVRVLFDLSDEHGLLWPEGLKDILRVLSEDITPEDWREPDVLGWVYQYYNTEANADLKTRKNKNTGFKMQPDDVPILNQFYSPDWVVRVLADNTLGRLWLEAKERDPALERDGASWRLRERREGVPEPNDREAFSSWLTEQPDPLRDLTVDRLCRFVVPLPSHTPPRPQKSVRDVCVLDPACGSGHFLLYSFDILFAMYREEEPELNPRAIPSLILERNLFGIDIDLRAAQLAAFGLYLKARETLRRIDPDAVLHLAGLNIVVADTHIGNDPRKVAFLDRYKDSFELKLVYEKVLSQLDHTNALGSLIKVRSEFEALFGHTKTSRREAILDASLQPSLLDVDVQPSLRATYDVATGSVTLEDLLHDLAAFEAEVAPSQDIGARLFYTDLSRSVGLLKLLARRYDVVLMNPPYGDMPEEAKDYMKGNRKKRIPPHYERTHAYFEAAFIEQALDLLHSNGLVGALVPRSFMYLTSLEKVRTEILTQEARPEFLQEYGLGILDGATVRTVGAVVRKATSVETPLAHEVAFHRLTAWPTHLKPATFLGTFPSFAVSGPRPDIGWYFARLASLQDIPGMPYAYWASDSLRGLFRRLPALDRDQKGALVLGRPRDKIAEVRVGLQTSDDERFLRRWWEAQPPQKGRGRRWVPFIKGGREVSFHARTDLLVNWENDGEEIKAWIVASTGGHWSKRVQSLAFYYRAGVTWPPASWRIRRFGMMPADRIFGHKGSCIFPVALSSEAVAGLLNSSVGTIAMLMQTPERMWEVGMVGKVPIPTNSFPESAVRLVTQLVEANRRAHIGDETSSDFEAADLDILWKRHSEGSLDLNALLGEWYGERRRRSEIAAGLVQALDEEAYALYEVSAADRAIIELELSRRPKNENGYDASEMDSLEQEYVESTTGSDDEAMETETEIPPLTPATSRDLVARWLSGYVRNVFDADEDGIVSVPATSMEHSLVYRVEEAMAADLGAEAAHGLASQAATFLGVASLEDWLAMTGEDTLEAAGKEKKVSVGFAAWHVETYDKRPIYWLLSSEGFGKPEKVFRAYVNFLKLTPDTLDRLNSHYVDPFLDRCLGEMNKAKARAGKADSKATAVHAEVEEWVRSVDAAKRFKTAIEELIAGPQTATNVPSNAKWLARTIAEVRGGKDVGHGYRPNIDYGVKVNIRPLVEKRVLPPALLKKLGG